MATATFATALAVLSVLGAVSRVCGSVQAENSECSGCHLFFKKEDMYKKEQNNIYH